MSGLPYERAAQPDETDGSGLRGLRAMVEKRGARAAGMAMVLAVGMTLAGCSSSLLGGILGDDQKVSENFCSFVLGDRFFGSKRLH